MTPGPTPNPPSNPPSNPAPASIPTSGAGPQAPISSLLEQYEVVHPDVPPAWDGATILHLTDLHVRRRRPSSPAITELLRILPQVELDLVVLTGDYPDKPRDEPAALEVLKALAAAWRCRRGAFGIWGNHDSAGIMAAAAQIPGVTWLDGDIRDLGDSLAVAGMSFPEDPWALAARLHDQRITPASHFIITLAHYPTEAYSAAALGLQLVLAGHTHGGQIRFSARSAPHTSGDMPGDLPSGLFAIGGVRQVGGAVGESNGPRVQPQTLVAVSRGLGEAVLPWRVNCPPQAPIYVLRRGELPSTDTRELRALRRW